MLQLQEQIPVLDNHRTISYKVYLLLSPFVSLSHVEASLFSKACSFNEFNQCANFNKNKWLMQAMLCSKPALATRKISRDKSLYIKRTINAPLSYSEELPSAQA